MSFAGAEVSLGGGLAGLSIASDLIGIMASAASSATCGSYHFGVPQLANITLPHVAAGDT